MIRINIERGKKRLRVHLRACLGSKHSGTTPKHHLMDLEEDQTFNPKSCHKIVCNHEGVNEPSMG